MHKHSDCIELSKNPTYYDKEKVQLEGMIGYFLSDDTALVMYEKNELHFIGSPLGAIPQDALDRLNTQNQVHTYPLLGTCFLRLNTGKRPS